MPLSDRVLEQQSLAAGEVASLSIGLPWFRSVPRSCVELLTVRIDDQQFETEQLKFDGKTSTQFFAPDEEWFLQDRVTVELPIPVKTNTQHEVEVRIRLSIPNLSLPNGKPVVIPSAAIKLLEAH
jgi:hypothetical protein